MKRTLARPQETAFGKDAYPDLDTKAAALLHSIAAILQHATQPRR